MPVPVISLLAYRIVQTLLHVHCQAGNSWLLTAFPIPNPMYFIWIYVRLARDTMSLPGGPGGKIMGQNTSGRVSRIYPKGKKMVVVGADTPWHPGRGRSRPCCPCHSSDWCPVRRSLPRSFTSLTIPSASTWKAIRSYDPLRQTLQVFFWQGQPQGPKDIPASVGQGSAAAAKVLGSFLERYARIRSGCGKSKREHMRGMP